MVRKGKEPASADPASAEQILTVTAQQSRFHNDAVNEPASKEVSLRRPVEVA